MMTMRWNRPAAEVMSLVSCLVILSWLVTLSACDAPKEPAPTNQVQALMRGTAHVEVNEMLDGAATDFNITQLLLQRSLSMHGFQLVNRDQADYVIEGTMTCDYFQDLTFDFQGQEQHLEHQYHGKFAGHLISKSSGGEVVQDLSFPEPLMNGRTQMELAQRDIRRRSATIVAENLLRGEILGDPEVRGLLDALTDPLDGRFYNQIQDELVQFGARAVPHLLEALRDERDVSLEGTYPGFPELVKGELKVYHIADLALRDLLDRDSGLDPLSSEEYLLRIRTGWQWLWEDFQKIPDELRVKTEQRANKTPAPVER
ncbi:MAG: hypothetical protein VX764_07565 [Planctomycetota bacterium]|nr:hypothetical protein [Planctomycetota bacterium]